MNHTWPAIDLGAGGWVGVGVGVGAGVWVGWGVGVWVVGWGVGLLVGVSVMMGVVQSVGLVLAKAGVGPIFAVTASPPMMASRPSVVPVFRCLGEDAITATVIAPIVRRNRRRVPPVAPV